MRVRGYATGAPCWADVSTGDPGGTQAFYTDLFGWQASTAEGYSLFQLGDRPVAGLAPVADPGDPPAWLIYVTVADVEITAKHVEKAGGRVLMPPVDMGEAGRTALFVDPTGAVFAGWQPGIFRGANAFNEPGALCWYTLSSPDPATALAFYADVFGWWSRPDDSSPGAFELINGEDSVAGLLPGPAPGWTAYLMVDDCLAAVERAAELGGRCVRPAVDTPLYRYAHVSDPGGAQFAVAQLAPEVRRALGT